MRVIVLSLFLGALLVGWCANVASPREFRLPARRAQIQKSLLESSVEQFLALR